MTDTEETPISGSITLTSSDHMRILAIQFPRIALGVAILLTTVSAVVGAIVFAFDDRLSFREASVAATIVLLQDLLPFITGSFLLALVTVAICSIIKWARFPQQNRIVSYKADERGMTTSDAAGASLNIPWSMVKRSRRTQRYIVMAMQAGHLRFLPFKAFSPDDAERLWQLVSAKTPVK